MTTRLMLLSLAFLESFLLGAAVVAIFWREARSSWASLLLQCATAWGIGAGLTSSLYFLWLRLAGRGSRGFLLLETFLILGGWTAFFVVRRRRKPESPSVPAAPAGLLTHLAIALFVFWGVLTLLCLILRHRYGGWDAVAMWNVHAKFFASPLPGAWRGMFTPGAGPTHLDYPQLPAHPDYPPLLSAFVAQAWACTGATAPLVPALVALFFTSGTALLLISSASFLRSPHAGLLAGALLLTSPTFLGAAMIQYADVPLSFYFLLSVVLLHYADRARRADKGLYVLAGLAAGCAALTKNEGSLFLVVLALSRLVHLALRRQVRQGLRDLVPIALGLAPLLLVLLYYKSFTSPNEIIAAQHGGLFAKMFTSSRYLTILKAARTAIFYPENLASVTGFKVVFNWQVPAFALFCLLVGFERKRALHASVLPVAFIAILLYLGYFVVYLLTPYELAWHLRTSLERLLAQVAPILILACLLGLGTFEPGNRPGPAPP